MIHSFGIDQSRQIPITDGDIIISIKLYIINNDDNSYYILPTFFSEL